MTALVEATSGWRLEQGGRELHQPRRRIALVYLQLTIDGAVTDIMEFQDDTRCVFPRSPST
jgi:hypothetical protein